MPFLPDPGIVESRRIAAATAYWRGLRREQAVPLRDALNPAEIKDLLPFVMLIDLENDPLRVRYRLVGTEIVTWAKFDFTGLYLDELTFSDMEETDVFIEGYRSVRRTGLPHYARIRTFQLHHRTLYYESAILPLSSDGVTIDKALAIEDYDKLSAEHLPEMPPSRRR